MKYMGSKNRHATEILKFIHSHNAINYYEPFVGGANIIDKVKIPNRFGCDIDDDLIALWQAVSQGWLPPLGFSEQQYKELKLSPPSALKGYVAFALSYGGKKWGGWCRDKEGKRDYVAEAYRNAIKQFPKLLGVNFTRQDYKTLIIPDGSVVYCDPPYANTTKYSSDFNHVEFWEWVRKISINNYVYVSEYNAPEDFKCVWTKQVNSSLTKDTGGKKNVEKLFVFNNQNKQKGE